MIIHSNEDSFENDTKGKVVLIDFYATWCAPCRMLSQELEELDTEKFDIVKIDVDDNPKLAKQYGVLAIPTMVVLVDGQEKEKLTGYKQKSEIADIMSKYFK